MDTGHQERRSRENLGCVAILEGGLLAFGLLVGAGSWGTRIGAAAALMALGIAAKVMLRSPEAPFEGELDRRYTFTRDAIGKEGRVVLVTWAGLPHGDRVGLRIDLPREGTARVELRVRPWIGAEGPSRPVLRIEGVLEADERETLVRLIEANLAGGQRWPVMDGAPCDIWALDGGVVRHGECNLARLADHPAARVAAFASALAERLERA